MASERVVFTFDNDSLETLNSVKEKGDFPSLGMAVRDSIHLTDFLQSQVDKGFSEIIVRNPDTQEEKTIVVSSLQKVAKKRMRDKAAAEKAQDTQAAPAKEKALAAGA